MTRRPLWALYGADVISLSGNAIAQLAVPWFVLVTTDISGGGWGEPVFSDGSLVGLSASQSDQSARIIAVLRREGPATATTLAERLGESSGATSYHLRSLARAGFVTATSPFCTFT